ncbi:MAG: hypothetical protein V4735_08330 [Pseudomonadota bacterium]
MANRAASRKYWWRAYFTWFLVWVGLLLWNHYVAPVDIQLLRIGLLGLAIGHSIIVIGSFHTGIPVYPVFVFRSQNPKSFWFGSVVMFTMSAATAIIVVLSLLGIIR